MPATKFEPSRDIPSLKGKVVLVTGGNAGIGKATIRAISLHSPARIYLCARRRLAAEAAVTELKNETNYSEIHILELDLASLDSVKKCAAEFNEKEHRLDLLFLNAGVANTAPALTQEGYELQFGINHVGHALLTQLLMPKILQTRMENSNADVRIVATSSDAAFAPFLPKGGLALSAMRQSDAYGPMGLYAHSKLANVLFIRKIAQLYPGISAMAAHPGTVKSDIWGKGAPGLFNTLFKPVVWLTSVDINQGAKSQLWCATAPLGGARGVKSGQYYQPVGKLRMVQGAAADESLADELWDWTNNELSSHGGKGWPSM